jgi:glycerophosphoryl diester phosphodiesterase
MQGAMDIEAKTPLLGKSPCLDADMAAPSFETAFPMRKRLERKVVASNTDRTSASWTWARKDKNGRRLPQAIAHRGNKANYPENTLAAFKGAVRVGAHAIETDIHLSRDDVVVLSHVSHRNTRNDPYELTLFPGLGFETML